MLEAILPWDQKVEKLTTTDCIKKSLGIKYYSVIFPILKGVEGEKHSVQKQWARFQKERLCVLVGSETNKKLNVSVK